VQERLIVEGVARWFKRQYGAGVYCGECTTQSGKRADLVYARQANSVHVVEAKAHADAMGQAFRQLSNYPGNYKWFALPQDEYENAGGGIASECSSRGYGLLLASGSPARLTVVARRVADYVPGNFAESWPTIFR
jgi:hypothetical protein